MKAFVTGATGFLGSHLVDLLLQEGHDVACLIRKTSPLRWLHHKKVRLITGDLLPDDPGLREGLRNADWCFHVAGVISSSNPQNYFQINAGGTRYCLDACLKAASPLKRFVLISSIAAIGPSQNGSALDEQSLPHPISIYGQSKLEAERITLGYTGKLPVTILRPPAIYGSRDKMILPVFKMAKKGFFLLPAGGPRFISMAYVEDVALAMLWAAKTEKAVGQNFFVADGDSYSWQDVADCLENIFYRRVIPLPLPKTLLWPIALFAESFAKFSHKAPRIHRGHVRQFYSGWRINIEKIKNAGFTPRFNLEAGMKATVAGYRQLGWL